MNSLHIAGLTVIFLQHVLEMWLPVIFFKILSIPWLEEEGGGEGSRRISCLSRFFSKLSEK